MSSGDPKLWHWQPESVGGWLFCAYARGVPEHPCKGRLLHMLARWCCRGGAWVRSAQGARFLANAEDYIGWEILCNGVFEPRTLDLAVRLMRKAPEGIFLDIGANQGVFTAAVGVGAACEVVAVEPAPEAFVQLQKVVAGNADLRAQLVHVCAAPNAGMIPFHAPQDGKGAWGHMTPKLEAARCGTISFWSATLPLNQILASSSVPRVHLVKLDVEGFEIGVLQGLNFQGPCRPCHVIMECGPKESSKIDFLTQQGYVARSVDGRPLDVGAENWSEGNLWFEDSNPGR